MLTVNGIAISDSIKASKSGGGVLWGGNQISGTSKDMTIEFLPDVGIYKKAQNEKYL